MGYVISTMTILIFITVSMFILSIIGNHLTNINDDINYIVIQSNFTVSNKGDYIFDRFLSDGRLYNKDEAIQKARERYEQNDSVMKIVSVFNIPPVWKDLYYDNNDLFVYISSYIARLRIDLIIWKRNIYIDYNTVVNLSTFDINQIMSYNNKIKDSSLPESLEEDNWTVYTTFLILNMAIPTYKTPPII